MRSQGKRTLILRQASTSLPLVGLLIASQAAALESAPTAGAIRPALAGVPVCATLDDFDGKVQLLDVSRSFVIDTEPNAAIPCGGWISVQSGWAKVIHRDGYRLQVGAGSFIQFARKAEEIPLVLYRGQFLLEAVDGSTPVRVVTANAKASVPQGRALVIYEEAREETQLIGLDRTVSLESRFEENTAVPVRPGHLSSLHQKALRLVPSPPAAVASGALQARLASLGLTSRDLRGLMAQVGEGQRKRLSDDRQARRPAGLVFDPDSYVRHREQAGDSALKQKLERRITGDTSDRQTLLYPKGRRGKGALASRSTAGKSRGADPLEALETRKKKEEELERSRLLDELSRVRSK